MYDVAFFTIRMALYHKTCHKSSSAVSAVSGILTAWVYLSDIKLALGGMSSRKTGVLRNPSKGKEGARRRDETVR
jgi:hypothetical protein